MAGTKGIKLKSSKRSSRVPCSPYEGERNQTLTSRERRIIEFCIAETVHVIGKEIYSITDKKLKEAGIPDVPDFTVEQVNEAIAWAEKVMLTPGIIRGARRRAAGIELIRRGVMMLRGVMDFPRDAPSKLKILTA